MFDVFEAGDMVKVKAEHTGEHRFFHEMIGSDLGVIRYGEKLMRVKGIIPKSGLICHIGAANDPQTVSIECKGSEGIAYRSDMLEHAV